MQLRLARGVGRLGFFVLLALVARPAGAAGGDVPAVRRAAPAAQPVATPTAPARDANLCLAAPHGPGSPLRARGEPPPGYDWKADREGYGKIEACLSDPLARGNAEYPEWVNQGSGAFSDAKRGRYFLGVGSYSPAAATQPWQEIAAGCAARALSDMGVVLSIYQRTLAGETEAPRDGEGIRTRNSIDIGELTVESEVRDTERGKHSAISQMISLWWPADVFGTAGFHDLMASVSDGEAAQESQVFLTSRPMTAASVSMLLRLLAARGVRTTFWLLPDRTMFCGMEASLTTFKRLSEAHVTKP